jgi:hypothetical protein
MDNKQQRNGRANEIFPYLSLSYEKYLSYREQRSIKDRERSRWGLARTLGYTGAAVGAWAVLASGRVQQIGVFGGLISLLAAVWATDMERDAKQDMDAASERREAWQQCYEDADTLMNSIIDGSLKEETFAMSLKQLDHQEGRVRVKTLVEMYPVAVQEGKEAKKRWLTAQIGLYKRNDWTVLSGELQTFVAGQQPV